MENSETLNIVIIIAYITAILMALWIVMYVTFIESGLYKWMWRKWHLKFSANRNWYTGQECTRITKGIDSHYNDTILWCKCGTSDCEYCKKK